MHIDIAIAEDNYYALKSTIQKLGKNPSHRIVGTANNGKELISLLQTTIPDLVLMDIQMPEMNGIECTIELKKLHPQVKIIMLTTFDDDEKIFDAILAGASGYLLKEETAEYLKQSIEETMDGGAAMSATIAMKVLKLVRQPLIKANDKTGIDFELTKREFEILEQLKSGISYEQIAANLFISYGTVRKHIEHIYRKLQVNNKTEAIEIANKNRLFH
ncbi:MAG: response regulator transcription factor [Chitinophagaceae bacterium]